MGLSHKVSFHYFKTIHLTPTLRQAQGADVNIVGTEQRSVQTTT
jgi:hypothetical protein